jgi:entericidin B
MRKIITLSLVAAALAVSACNTIAGAGRDVSAAGSAVSSGRRTTPRTKAWDFKVPTVEKAR